MTMKAFWFLSIVLSHFIILDVVAVAWENSTSVTNTSAYCVLFKYTFQVIPPQTTAEQAIFEVNQGGLEFVNQSFHASPTNIQAVNLTTVSKRFLSKNVSNTTVDDVSFFCQQAGYAQPESSHSCGLVSAKLCTTAPTELDPKRVETVSWSKIQTFFQDLPENPTQQLIYQGPIDVKTRFVLELRGAKRYLTVREKQALLDVLTTVWSKLLPYPLQSMGIVMEHAIAALQQDQQQKDCCRRRLSGRWFHHLSNATKKHRLLEQHPGCTINRQLQASAGLNDWVNSATRTNMSSSKGGVITATTSRGNTTGDTSGGENDNEGLKLAGLSQGKGDPGGSLEDLLAGADDNEGGIWNVTEDTTNGTRSATGGTNRGGTAEGISNGSTTSGGGASVTSGSVFNMEDISGITNNNSLIDILGNFSEELPPYFSVGDNEIPINTIEILILTHCEGAQDCTQANLEKEISDKASTFIGADGSILLDQLKKDAEANLDSYFDDVFTIMLDQVGSRNASAATLDINVTNLLERAHHKIPPLEEHHSVVQVFMPSWVWILVVGCCSIFGCGLLLTWYLVRQRNQANRKKQIYKNDHNTQGRIHSSKGECSANVSDASPILQDHSIDYGACAKVIGGQFEEYGYDKDQTMPLLQGS